MIRLYSNIDTQLLIHLIESMQSLLADTLRGNSRSLFCTSIPGPGLLEPGLELKAALLKCRLRVEACRANHDRSGVDNPPSMLGLYVIIEP